MEGEDYINMYLQYCEKPSRSHGIPVQHNHRSICDCKDAMIRLVCGYGADIHVIKDDGTEVCVCLGAETESSTAKATYAGGCHTYSRNKTHKAFVPLYESLSVHCIDGGHHKGLRIIQGECNEISRNVIEPRFYYCAFEKEGVKYVSDWMDGDTVSQKCEKSLLVIGAVVDEPPTSLKLTKLLYPKTCWPD